MCSQIPHWQKFFPCSWKTLSAPNATTSLGTNRTQYPIQPGIAVELGQALDFRRFVLQWSFPPPKSPRSAMVFPRSWFIPWKAWFSREGNCYNINKALFPFMGFNSELQCLHHFFFYFFFALLVIFFSSFYLVLWNNFQSTLNPFTSPQVCLRLINVLAVP